MWSGNQFIVRRSPFVLAFQIVAALAFIGIGLWVLFAKQDPLPTGGQKLLGWLAIAGGVAALLVLGLRARQPAQLLTIDQKGLTWWKAERIIGWAEVAEVRIDAYRSTFFLHLKLAPAAAVDAALPHPTEALGRLLLGSDLSLRLSGSDAKRDEVREALTRLAPAHVRILPALD